MITLFRSDLVRRLALVGALVLFASAPCVADEGAPAPEANTAAGDNLGDVTTLATFNVTGERLEDFGFRVSPDYDAKRSMLLWSVVTPVVDVLLPNTAASKAGMQPGDRIVSSDGKSTAAGSFSSSKWRRIQEKKWAELAAGKENVTWTLQVESVETGELRTLTLLIPTPAPHWGASIWSAPEDRSPATVPEPGPLAEKAGIVLNHGIWTLLRGSYVRGLNIPVTPQSPYFLCYEWTLWSGDAGHRIYVSRQRGSTDVILEAISRNGRGSSSALAPASDGGTLTSPTTIFAVDSRAYLTSPSGWLEKAWRLSRGSGQREIPPEEARDEFEAEKDFWITKVGQVSPRWPLSLITTNSGSDHPVAAEGDPAPTGGSAGPGAGRPGGTEALVRAAAFLKLPPATQEQRTLFERALGQLGADEDHWAYTETVQNTEDKGETEVRVDPSKPDEERCTLLKVNGKLATPEDLRKWREAGRDDRAPLGGLPPLESFVDLADLRVLEVDAGAIVFEAPLRVAHEGLSPENFQALFRVNKASRDFESISIQIREAVRVAKLTKLTEAGIRMKFGSIDPAFPSQPVWIRTGGAARMLLIKVTSVVETTRSDFRRVEPYREPGPTK
jgi:hypothetical protein